MGTNDNSLNKQTNSKTDLLTKAEFIAWLLTKSHNMILPIFPFLILSNRSNFTDNILPN